MKCILCSKEVYNTGKDCINVTCSLCIEKINGFEEAINPLKKLRQKKLHILEEDKFYIIISSYGYILKTKIKEDYDTVRKWKIAYSGIHNNNECINYILENGKKVSKWIRYINESNSFEEKYYYEMDNLDIERNIIKEVNLKSKEPEKDEIIKSMGRSH